jgi:hypothetical protein
LPGNLRLEVVLRGTLTFLQSDKTFAQAAVLWAARAFRSLINDFFFNSAGGFYYWFSIQNKQNQNYLH